MMKGTKVLSVLLAGVMSMSCLGMHAFAVQDANEYPSVSADLDADQLQEWYDEVVYYHFYDKTEAELTTLTLSEPYYYYNFYDMAVDEGVYIRIVSLNGEVVGLSTKQFEDGVETCFAGYSEYDLAYVEEGLDNNGKILFGRAWVDRFPCGLVYVDGTMYSYTGAVGIEQGETDLVFGEIAYSDPYWTDLPEEADGALLPGCLLPATTTEAIAETVVIGIGDVNLDGQISLRDVVAIKKITAGTMQASDEQNALADCCADGLINASDATALLEYILEKVETLPVTPE
ncbi:MAG: dockerin type I repeat-containing protein [Ruminococcus sp.]|nr:dockerin type I repeat-containing protein [Ruminococcus sp.]